MRLTALLLTIFSLNIYQLSLLDNGPRPDAPQSTVSGATR